MAPTPENQTSFDLNELLKHFHKDDWSEVFLIVHASGHKFDPSRNVPFHKFIKLILKNRKIDRLRRNRSPKYVRSNPKYAHWKTMTYNSEIAEALSNGKGSQPLDHLISEESQEILKTNIQKRLSEQQSEVLMEAMRIGYVKGAESMGTNLGTFKSRMHRIYEILSY